MRHVASLRNVVAEASSKRASRGLAWLALFLFYFFVREQKVPTPKRMSPILSFYGTFSLLKVVERVKVEAESALELFEKLKKKSDKMVFFC